MTSHDVVNRLRRIFGTKRVGHAGTLDPIATGVLVVCIGQATRILEYLTATRKRYVAGVLFGIRTDSQDITGQEISRVDASHLRQSDVEAVLERFRGSILQVPPMHSAVHHMGKRLYELARQGVEVDRDTREIEIHHLEMLAFSAGHRPRATLDIECSSGTYIRTLAADIGEALGTGAVMDSLRRTAVGSFCIEDARTLDELVAMKEAGDPKRAVIPMRDALPDWPTLTLTTSEAAVIRQGRSLPGTGVVGNAMLLDGLGQVVGLAQAGPETIAPFKVFPEEEV